MQIPIQRYFRILVVGERPAAVAPISEAELGFRTVTVDERLAREAIYHGDVGHSQVRSEEESK